MKTYCKRTVVDYGFVANAYDKWLHAPAGKKNAWRVESEYGSADKLIAEITGEIDSRTLTFRPIHRYQHSEPCNGKVRTIGVLSVKQQVVDYVIDTALFEFIDAKLGFYQISGVKGKGTKLARSAMRRWIRDGKYHVKVDVEKCYPSISTQVVMDIVSKHVKNDTVL